MRSFQDGEQARVFRRGAEVEVTVFRQVGQFVYVFDRENRPYQFGVTDVLPFNKVVPTALEVFPQDGPHGSENTAMRR